MPDKAMQKSARAIGVVMDGNRRYAKKMGQQSILGHKAGYNKLKELLRWVKEAGVEYVTAYAFSTENWNRTSEEVKYLLDLFKSALENELGSLHEEGVRIRFAGDLGRFSPTLRELMIRTEKETSENAGPVLVLALSYGGRSEILQAVEKARLSKDVLDEKSFSSLLWTTGIPDPDLILRTGGETRLSNFLPWQSVYSELFFTDTLWPELSKGEFMDILEQYKRRDKRFGK